MDKSLVAAEYLLRARRTLKEAQIAFEDGDLYYTVIRTLDTVENLAKVLLSLKDIFRHDLFWNTTMLLNDENALEKKLRDLEYKLIPITLINESSLKTPTVVIRNKEAEMLVDEISKILEEVEKAYDEYHD
ncbi:HEPN domain-containing protein [Sulfolobus sp. E5-1-F]|uniref:HEPN domain-containing protein n=1 Tax=Sulfolobaceae TaxID=118883 RepID=UPI001297F23B|nr:MULTISPECIES: HEPN domain-containing protein [unclassified Sulfolobus]QGA53552.1 HEPN domain-containing protein [Sulfolobus sp. E5-1-F]QGA68781.1 HEPN domain-containing protein [Sulfolobus sp. E11-6]